MTDKVSNPDTGEIQCAVSKSELIEMLECVRTMYAQDRI